MERDKLMLEAEKNAHISYTRQEKNFDVAEMLFQGVNSQLALKKRYKDLIILQAIMKWCLLSTKFMKN